MKKIAFALTLLFAMCMPAMLHADGWTNPMRVEGSHNGGYGDPYIMKYRGYYYLYVSARDEKIYCWRSKDLMEWSTAYICSTDQTTAVAYAPEVIYWNGRFYMCTSPRGGGHYMLTSDSPTGPFVHQTGNMGRDIDGSMFVDDDGQWYFLHANNAGIHGCTMPTHLSFGSDVNLGCCMSGQWTEGPCMFKRNGLYYLLYTGNHVWTNGYRIDYAISNGSPLSGFRPQSEQNPILVDTETFSHKALGHGTAFVGPDLDTYFFCYHNLLDDKSHRLLNFERIAWNGDKLMMTGPTDWEQDRPLVASNDYFERTDIGGDWTMPLGGDWQIAGADHLAQTSADGMHTAIFAPDAFDDYTAEFTVKAAANDNGGLCGALFSYQDVDNYSEVLIDVASRRLTLNNYQDGAQRSTRSVSLPDDFDPATWHALRVEKNGRTTRIYIDGMRKFLLTNISAGGQVGYVSHDCAADFSYIAFSPYVDGSGILGVSLPVPGMLAANLCAVHSDDVRAANYAMTVGNSTYMRCQAGSTMTYRVNIQRDNVYNIGLRYRSSAASRVRLLLDGQVVCGPVELPSSRSQVVVQTLKDVALPGGHHELTVEVTDGSPFIYEYNIKRGVEHPHVMADNFDQGFNEEWGYREGNWTIVDGQLESTGRYGKMLMGGYDDIHLTDYTAECDVIYTGNGMNGGLLFRTTNASTGGADDNPQLGTDFLQGYIFIAGTTSVALGKHNFGWQSLASADKNVDPGQPHHMKVVVEGARIRCYLDDMTTPLIDYTDPVPFITGRAGFRAHDTSMRFDNFVVTPTADDASGIMAPWRDGSQPQRLYNLLGQSVTAVHPHSLYIVNSAGQTRKVVR